MDKRVNILMLTYNQPQLEADCLSSIVKLTEHLYSITVHDNRGGNTNLAQIWNKLIRESVHSYLLFLNSDTVVERGWLSKLISTFEEIPRLGAIGPVTNRCGYKYQIRRIAQPRPNFQEAEISGFCLLTKKEIFNKVGYFDEEFDFYGQESEWLVRVKKAGYWVGFREDVFVSHLGGASIKKREGFDLAEARKRGGELYREKRQELEQGA